MNNTPYDPKVLRQLIKDVLTPLDLYSDDVCELLMFTAANESHLGQYRMQINGPARGIFQCEGNTFNDIYNNFLRYHPDLEAKINALAPIQSQEALKQGGSPHVDDLINDDAYAIAICRAHYRRIGPPIPNANDIEAIWAYYKKWYNSYLGAATHDAAIQNYTNYVTSKEISKEIIKT